MDILYYFTDPILRAPTLGCILMCVAASLTGVVLLLQKKMLISESASHASYPGAVIGVLVLSIFGPEYEEFSFLAVLGGALISSWLGLKAICILEGKCKIRSDAALCFALATFFGVGVLLASGLQQTKPIWLQQIQVLLFGQAATLTDGHILMYGLLTFGCVLFIAFSFRHLQAFLFDRNFSKAIGIRVRTVERIFLWLLLVSIVAGIRSVGVILMSGMLIAPAVAARQFSNQLKIIFWLAAMFGALSGLIGSILSVHWQIPTGPAIVLVGTGFAFLGMLISPKRGILFRLCRQALFRIRCLEENILKGLWKNGSMDPLDLKRQYPSMLSIVLFRLIRQGWITRKSRAFYLTEDGHDKAVSIVRLHRLWELYLTEELGRHPERVHRSAEEMEHVLTPELEEHLTNLLSNPQIDPHEQPIPNRRFSR